MKVLFRLLALLIPYRKLVFCSIGLMLAFALLRNLPPLVVRHLVDNVLDRQGKSPLTESEAMAQVWGHIGLFLLLTVLSNVNFFARIRLTGYLGQLFVYHVRIKTFEKLQNLSLDYFETRRTGDIMARMTSDVEVLDTLASDSINTTVVQSLTFLFAVVLLLVINWKLALVSFAIVPLLGWFVKTNILKLRKTYRAIRERLAEINADLNDRLEGIRVIKAFSEEETEQRKFKAVSREYMDRNLEGIRLRSVFWPSVNVATAIGGSAVLALGSMFYLRGQASIGDLVVFYYAYLNPFLYEPLMMMSGVFDTILRAIAAGERILAIWDTPETVSDFPDAKPMPRINGEVRFEHVSFAYQSGDTVLEDINFTAPPGSLVALVGKSGAGKTSLINLLMRFYDPISGKVLIDGTDLKTVQQRSLREQIAVVLQDTFLFNGTVKENIRYARPEADDSQIIAAAKTASAHDFIQHLPNGYDTQIGERGIKLSGGQKQRVAIARAVLADPRILILDEATSNVDSESERLIQAALEELMKGRTSFVIAHRLSTIRRADLIITLDQGRIVEMGRHDQLLEAGGIYAELHDLQFAEST
jgi:subfamily B ATP-binding cassette protein MsbA